MKGHRRMPSIHGVEGRRKKLVIKKELEAALKDWGRREGGESLGEQDFQSGKKSAPEVTRGQNSSAGVFGKEEVCVPSKPEKRKREMEMVEKLEKRQKVGWGGWVERNLPFWAAKILGGGE